MSLSVCRKPDFVHQHRSVQRVRFISSLKGLSFHSPFEPNAIIILALLESDKKRKILNHVPTLVWIKLEYAPILVKLKYP